MIRFILKGERLDGLTGLKEDWFYTIDLKTPLLERELTRGGRDESGYETVSLVGVEVIPEDVSAKSVALL